MRPTVSPRRRSQSLETPKRPVFFFSLPRQPAFAISRDPARHKDIKRPPISHPIQIAPRFGSPQPRNVPTPQPAVSVSPHTSAWIQVADHVVGRHPYGKPLITRVATPAEIALISGHVHIPWAYAHTKKTQPVPVRVQKPAVTCPPISIMPPLALEDAGNTQGRLIWRAVNNNTKLFKCKSPRHAREKENTPILPAPAYSTRR